MEECASELEDVAERVRMLSDFEGDDATQALDRVESRLAALAALTRKYGGSESAVLSFWHEAKEKLAALESMEADFKDAEEAYKRIYAETCEASDRLNASRKKAAREIEKEVSEMLHALDMPFADFRIDFEEKTAKDSRAFSEEGDAIVTFMIAINKGEPFVSVTKCASGGEISRIMLAIKSVIAKHDGMPTIIFDEVDSGVSGKTSRKIGHSLKRSAEGAQILCITHSAQIASLADEHFRVSKHECEGRTESMVQKLSFEERVEELARILGGILVTDSQRMAARDMLLHTDK